jgi:hypothetical protein
MSAERAMQQEKSEYEQFRLRQFAGPSPVQSAWGGENLSTHATPPDQAAGTNNIFSV